MRPAIVFAVSGIFLTGCGGGSTGPAVQLDASALRVFADESGVGKISISSEDENATGYVIAPDLGLVIEELRAIQSISTVDTAGVAAVGSGPNTIVSEGAISEGGVVLNVLDVTTTDEDASVTLLEDPSTGDSILFVGGDTVQNIPMSGVATYEGVIGMQNQVFDDAPELGTFTASIDFGAATPVVDFDGTTANFTVTGEAPVSGNGFAAADLVILDSGEPLPIEGRLNGDFHGDGANSMAGVIYSTDTFGNIRGAFVGSK